MENFLKNYATKFKKSKRTKDQLCTDLVYEGMSRQLAYGLIAGIVKRHGRLAVIEIYTQVAKSGCRDMVKLFMWRIKQNKVPLKEVASGEDVVK